MACTYFDIKLYTSKLRFFKFKVLCFFFQENKTLNGATIHLCI